MRLISIVTEHTHTQCRLPETSSSAKDEREESKKGMALSHFCRVKRRWLGFRPCRRRRTVRATATNPVKGHPSSVFGFLRQASVVGEDQIGDRGDEFVGIVFVEPCPLAVGIELEKPEFAVFADKVEAPEAVAGFGHEGADCAFFGRREFARNPFRRIVNRSFPDIQRIGDIRSRIAVGEDFSVCIDDGDFVLAFDFLLEKPRIGNVQLGRIDFLDEKGLSRPICVPVNDFATQRPCVSSFGSAP